MKLFPDMLGDRPDPRSASHRSNIRDGDGRDPLQKLSPQSGTWPDSVTNASSSNLIRAISHQRAVSVTPRHSQPPENSARRSPATI
jgi:hypothetical protein